MTDATKVKVLAEMKARVEANGSLNWADANEIAEMFEGVKARSVTAMASRNSIAYARKVRTAKDGSAVVSKADLVGKIADAFGFDVATLDGLDKANKTALEAVVAGLSEFNVSDEDEAGDEG